MDDQKNGNEAATAQEVIEITGPLDAAVVTSILATGATRAEVLDAFVHFASGETADRRIGPALDATARQVLDILQSECEPPERD